MKTQFFENDYVRVMYTSKCACSNQISYRFYCCVITLTPYLRSDYQCETNFLIGLFVIFPCFLLRAFLHEGGGPQVGEVSCHVVGHPTYQVNVIKLKREILWTGGLPHLPGLPHPYVNRALNHTTVANAILLLSRMKSS